MPGEVDYGFMYHGITYADEAILPEEKNKMTVNFWHPRMGHEVEMGKDIGGVIKFKAPEECTEKRFIKEMSVREFGEKNFSGLSEFTEEEVAD